MKTYVWLKVLICWSLWRNRKITFRKLANMAACTAAYFRKVLASARYPSVIFFDISNKCNYHCVACRETPEKIYDQNPRGESPIPVGDMDFGLYQRIIAEVKDHITIAVLYVNGEPLLAPRLIEMLRYATACHVATMISTNAMLLTPRKAEEIIGAGVDFIKIAVSGFTQNTYVKYHRGGNVETVKRNIEGLVDARFRLKKRLLIMVDYIVFQHNQNEIALFREYCNQHGLVFNTRAGITQGKEGVVTCDTEGLLKPKTALCDWLWKILVVNWNGDILPCCEFSTWSDPCVMNRDLPEGFGIDKIWNGDVYKKFRALHIRKGRQAIPRCADCHYEGVKLQG